MTHGSRSPGTPARHQTPNSSLMSTHSESHVEQRPLVLLSLLNHSRSLATRFQVPSVPSSNAEDLLPSAPCSCSSVQTNGSSSESSLNRTHRAHFQNRQATVDALADDILVEIFKFYIWGLVGIRWHTLVHVCRRWRYVCLDSHVTWNWKSSTLERGLSRRCRRSGKPYL